MAYKLAGNEWLKEHFGLINYSLTHSSYIGSNNSIELTSNGNIEQVYGPKYAVKKDTTLMHIEFSLKYDDLSLDFLKSVFEKIDIAEINKYIAETKSGRYARRIGYLYEFLMNSDLIQENEGIGNYIDLLDQEKYFTGKIIKNSRWRINDNLLGTAEFCPIIRRTKSLQALLEKNITQKLEDLKQEFPEDIFRRTATYLYNKETSSSYEIEKEKPSPDRMQRFIKLLTHAGAMPTVDVLSKGNLIELQNIIVDQRYAATNFRDFQNYVGKILANYQNKIHYICPPPATVDSMMNGLQHAANKTFEVEPIIRATLFSFGFVLIHPFEDGNGRLHRFIIHDVLVHDSVVPNGLIIPVSAHMLNNIKAYDQILAGFSNPLMQRIKYDLSEDGEITVKNLDEVERYYRYPDFTKQATYLTETLHATINKDMPEELLFLLRYDDIKRRIQNIVDMPDRDINLMIQFLHQNKGILPNKRREHFAKLTDQEIIKMQHAFKEVYELN